MTAALRFSSTRSTHDPKLVAKLAQAAKAIRTIAIAAIYLGAVRPAPRAVEAA